MNTIGSNGGYSAAMMSGMQGVRPNPAQMAQQLYSKADADNDGAVSQAEFTSLLQDTAGNTDSETVEGLFSQLDADGDGTLSKQETSAAIESLLGRMRQDMAAGPRGMGGKLPPPPDSNEFMSAADTDGDGNLTESEFTTALEGMGISDDGSAASRIAEMFSEADSDGDGAVTAEELQAAMQAHQPPSPGQSAEYGDSDTVSMLIQALLDNYRSDRESSGTLSATA